MGSISTGVGLISGIDTAALIDSLIQLESRPKTRLENRIAQLQAQQAAILDINARLLNLKSAARSLRIDSIFGASLATSSNEELLTATAGKHAQPGTFKFIVHQLLSNSQKMTRGFATADSTPVGLDSISFEFGRGRVATDTPLENLNGGQGVDRGRIVITTADGSNASVDLTDVVHLTEVVDRINSAIGVDVTARTGTDGLIVTDNSGGSATTFRIENAIGDTTATDLGIATTDGGAGDGDATADGTITGASVNTPGLNTSLGALNDGHGVLIQDGVDDLEITARDGVVFTVDLGRLDSPITTDTSLDDLNNGAGITIDDDGDDPDISFIDRDGTQHDVDLTGVTTVGGLINRVNSATGGAINITITNGEQFTVTDTTGGSGLLQVEGAGTGGTQTAEDLGILNEAGVSADTFDGQVLQNADHEPAASRLSTVLDRINNATGNDGRITASLGAGGIVITDNTASTASNLIVASTAANPHAASGLGIEQDVAASSITGDRLHAALNSVMLDHLNGGAGVYNTAATLTGQTLIADLFQGAGLTTSGDALADINVQDRTGATYQIDIDGLVTVQDLIDTFNTATSGAVTLAINGQTLEATNTTSGASNFQITDSNGATAATSLGIVIDSAPGGADVVTGTDTDPFFSNTLDITNRSGTLTSVDLSGLHSLSQVVETINNAGAGVTASVNGAGNGLLLTDTTGGTSNLIVGGSIAGTLGIATDATGVAQSTVNGANVQHQYVSHSTSLDQLNYGRGIGTGSFVITDSDGGEVTISIGDDAKTVFDVIEEINALASAQSVDVLARINDSGDGILLENTNGDGTITVAVGSGSTARDLNLLGSASAGESIDGSYERVVDLSTADTLNEVVQKINDAGIPVSAAVLNTGLGATPFRLNFASEIDGANGELVIDTGGVDLGITTLARGQDARIFFGADTAEDGLLISASSNTVDDILPGLTLDLHEASDEVITVTVDRDTETIVEAVKRFVTTFNDAVGRIDEYDYFNVETEEKGILLGDPLTSRVRAALFSTLRKPAEGVDGAYRFLTQVGIKVGSGGQVQFDEEKFRSAYELDPQGVEELFTAFEGSTQTTQQIAPGITVSNDSQTYTRLGLGDIFDQLLDGLTNSVDGSVKLADKNLQRQIDLAQDRIEAVDERLVLRRQRLQEQFVAMEIALAQLQAQSGSLLSMQIPTIQRPG